MFDDRSEKIFRQMSDSSIKNWVGPGDPSLNGRQNADVVLKLACLEDAARVTLLDFGCGIGRTSVGLLERMPNVTLIGLDIVPEMIEFCKTNIQSAFPNSQFFCSDTSHPHYDTFKNKRSIILEPEKSFFSRFNQSIDVIFAFSVFTHLDEFNSIKYFQLLRNCLKPKGLIIFSAYLLDNFSRNQMNSQHGKYSRHIAENDDIYINDKDLLFVAFKTEKMSEILDKAELFPRLILHGNWRQNIQKYSISSWQDCIVAVKSLILPKDFDSEKYISMYPDLIRANVDGAKHYLNHGYYEGRTYK